MAEQRRPILYVFTFKEGLLARLGHDLRLSATRFSIAADRGRITAKVALDSLVVDGAMNKGVLDAHSLDSSDRSKILEHARQDVLEIQKERDATFEGEARAESPERFALHGTLRMHGQTHPLHAQAFIQGAELVAQADLRPSDWGIAPFRALAGAIRVEDRVRVELRAPLPARAPTQPLQEQSFSLTAE